MGTVRIREIEHLGEAARRIGTLSEHLIEEIENALERFVGQDHAIGSHVEFLVVEGQPIRVDFFVDTDGTLWVQDLGTIAACVGEGGPT